MTKPKLFEHDSYTNPCLKELLQNLQFLLGPGPCIFWSDFQLQCLVILWVKCHPALQHICLEHDDSRLIGVHNCQLDTVYR